MREEEDYSYFENREFQKILYQYEDAVSHEQSVYMDADDLTDIAEYYMMNGRPTDAMEAIHIALALHPDSVDPQVFLARQAMFEGKLKKATRICNAIPNQEDREVTFLKAELLMRKKDDHAAHKFLLKEAEKVTDEKDMFYYDCTGIFIDYSQWETAELWANRLQQEFPNYQKIKPLLVDIYMGKEEFGKAIPLLGELIDDDPFNVNLWNTQAHAYEMIGDHYQAIECCEYVLAIETNNEKALCTKANSLVQMEQFDRADAIFVKLLQNSPDNDVFHYMHGVCLFHTQRLEEAAHALEMANETGGGMSAYQPFIYIYQAMTECQLQHYDRALEAVRGLRQCTDDEHFVEASLLEGQILMEIGQAEDAMLTLKDAMKYSSDRRATLTRIGIIFMQMEALDLAEDIFSGMKKMYSDEKSDESNAYLAYIHMMQHKDELFLSELKECTESCYPILKHLFSEYYPGVQPSEYYLYAYKRIHGIFP